ncbi:MAG: type II toxin-antitoxin system RelE/ParE family toxin [Chlorobiaceae bacterium]|nr:type II toxin-antitoxin system RelE/ParE family toxin [Chlorobiaceae bacterium]
MKVVFLKYARQELDDAIQFYEMEFSGLGQSFSEEVKKAVSRIVAYPEAWPLEREDIRKCMLHKFPYTLLYSVEQTDIVIIAVAHQHRKPEYWVDRKIP